MKKDEDSGNQSFRSSGNWINVTYVCKRSRISWCGDLLELCFQTCPECTICDSNPTILGYFPIPHGILNVRTNSSYPVGCGYKIHHWLLLCRGVTLPDMTLNCDGKLTKIPKWDFIFARVKTGQVGTWSPTEISPVQSSFLRQIRTGILREGII